MQHSANSRGPKLFAKPTKRNLVKLPTGPISRQLLRGESSHSKPNTKPNTKSRGKQPQLPPRPANFKKPLQVVRTGRPKRGQNRLPTQGDVAAVAHLNAEGFYNVTVEYSHRSQLATGCGLQLEDVDQALMEDNQQRRNEMENNSDREMNEEEEEEEEGPDISFDPEMDDEIESGEDLQ